QLSAPGAGGLMRELVAKHGSFQLTNVFRFHQAWEKEASVRLRAGDEEVLSLYDQHGRLRGGTREEMEQGAVEAYLADHLSGQESLLLTVTNPKAHELAGRVRERLVSYGLVDDAQTVQVRGGNRAGVGDLVTARRNDSGTPVTVDGKQRTLTNRDRLRVRSVSPGGRLRGELVDEDGNPGSLLELKADYVSRDIELAYAGTAHAGQGRTVDTSHAVVEDGMSRQALYVEMSRGREGNWSWVVTDTESADLRPEQAGPSETETAVSGPDATASEAETEHGQNRQAGQKTAADQAVIPGLEPATATTASAPEASASGPETTD